ncbi:MAG: magnesium/cobalt transporter CorA [Deltaproteobacteria bacterium]|nr:magnesium/cobalt transporter CorA [Deltaproteobacteria bacterium]
MKSAKKPKTAIGLAPGSLIHVGLRKQERSVLDLYHYGPDFLERRTDIILEDCRSYRESEGVTWINLEGIHDVSLVEGMGALFDIHSLALEDILDTDHPPKLEIFEKNMVLILKMLTFNEERLTIEKEQLSLILGRNHVISFQEREPPGDVFSALRARIEKKGGQIRNRGADYLAYALFDSVVDSYFLILDHLGDHLISLEQELTDHPTRDALARIHRFRSELTTLRRSVWPLREIAGNLLRNDYELVHENIRPFLRDLYDHTIQVIDVLEIYRDSLASLLDLYLSSASHRMNEVMKVLTIIATLFIPLTFIAGVYGMNFKFMPELEWRWGYPLVLLVMAGCGLGMIRFFRKKNWL